MFHDTSPLIAAGVATVRLALALPGARVFADHHDHTVTADHLALIADRLNARLDLHRIPLTCNLITGGIRGLHLRWELRYPFEHDLNGARGDVYLATCKIDDTTSGRSEQFHYWSSGKMRM